MIIKKEQIFSKYEEQTVAKCEKQFKVLSVDETRAKLRSY